MAMLKAQMRDHVRLFLDTDTEEHPDALLDVFFEGSLYRILRDCQWWKFYETEWTFSTVADTGSYSFATISPSPEIGEIRAVQGENWELRPLPHEQAKTRFALQDFTSEPEFWSVFDDTLYLWPIPGDAYDMVVRGHREPSVTDDPPDLPDEFHPILAKMMVAQTYQQMDDEIMSRELMMSAEQELVVASRRYKRASTAGISALNSGQEATVGVSADRMRFDWEPGV